MLFRSLIFATKLNTGDAIAIERMRIDASGNVGIGTSAPGYKLDVAGDARIAGKSFYTATYSVPTAVYVPIYLNAASSTMPATIALMRSTDNKVRKGICDKSGSCF